MYAFKHCGYVAYKNKTKYKYLLAHKSFVVTNFVFTIHFEFNDDNWRRHRIRFLYLRRNVVGRI